MGVLSGDIGARWRARLLALPVAVALLAAACGPAAAPPASPSAAASSATPATSAPVGTIVIGGVGPLSQPGAVSAGQDMKWAMETAVSDVNADGLLVGKRLVLDFEDTQNKPDVAATVAKKLVDEKHVVAVAGEYHSGAALAMIPTLAKANVPAVFAETWADAITAGDPKSNLPARPANIFRIAPSSSYAGGVLSDWLLNGYKAKDVIEFYEASDFGQSQRDTMKAQLAGITLTQIQVQLNQPDYSSIVARAKQDHPRADAVIFDVTGDSSYVIEENAYQAGLIRKGTVCVANQVAQDSAAFWRAVPDGAGCVFRYVGPVPSQYNAMTKSLADRYQKQFNRPPKNWVFEAYDSVRLVADAIKRAGSTDPAKVIAALEQTHFVGAQGEYAFPYGSGTPVPQGKPAWLWHQWPNPPIQMVEYTKKGQPIGDVTVIWPALRQSTPGTAYVETR